MVAGYPATPFSPLKTTIMKKLLLLLSLAFIIPIFSDAQTQSLNKFYRKYKRGKESVNFTLPGFVFKLGAAIGKNHVETEAEKEAVKLAKGIKKMRLLVIEDFNPVTTKDYNKLIKGVNNEGLEEMITVRTEGTRVNLLMREKKEKIKNLLILVSSEDTFVMVSAKTKLKLEQIVEVVNQAIDESEKEEVEEKASEPTKPQA